MTQQRQFKVEKTNINDETSYIFIYPLVNFLNCSIGDKKKNKAKIFPNLKIIFT